MRGNLHFLHQSLDILNAIVGGGIEFIDAIGSALRERHAGLALAAWLHICRRMHAVDGFCEDACGAGLAYTARAAEEIGVGQLAAKNGILQ